MNRARISATLLVSAGLTVVGWAVYQFLGVPWPLVVAVGALLIAAVLVSPAADSTPDDIDGDWADE